MMDFFFENAFYCFFLILYYKYFEHLNISLERCILSKKWFLKSKMQNGFLLQGTHGQSFILFKVYKIRNLKKKKWEIKKKCFTDCSKVFTINHINLKVNFGLVIQNWFENDEMLYLEMDFSDLLSSSKM